MLSSLQLTRLKDFHCSLGSEGQHSGVGGSHDFFCDRDGDKRSGDAAPVSSWAWTT